MTGMKNTIGINEKPVFEAAVSHRSKKRLLNLVMCCPYLQFFPYDIHTRRYPRLKRTKTQIAAFSHCIYRNMGLRYMLIFYIAVKHIGVFGISICYFFDRVIK